MGDLSIEFINSEIDGVIGISSVSGVSLAVLNIGGDSIPIPYYCRKLLA